MSLLKGGRYIMPTNEESEKVKIVCDSCQGTGQGKNINNDVLSEDCYSCYGYGYFLEG
jgi:DnaJ-class molecular chaperone